jgi:hypothetical protein
MKSSIQFDYKSGSKADADSIYNSIVFENISY